MQILGLLGMYFYTAVVSVHTKVFTFIQIGYDHTVLYNLDIFFIYLNDLEDSRSYHNKNEERQKLGWYRIIILFFGTLAHIASSCDVL